MTARAGRPGQTAARRSCYLLIPARMSKTRGHRGEQERLARTLPDDTVLPVYAVVSNGTAECREAQVTRLLWLSLMPRSGCT
jgi:hypothetical protein